MPVSYNFYKKEVPSNLEIKYKKGMYFSFDLGWLFYPSWYCLLRTGVGGFFLFFFLLKGQNLSSVIKIICEVSKESKLMFLTKEFVIDKNYIFQCQYKNKNIYSNSNKIWVKVFSKSEDYTCIAEPNLKVLPLTYLKSRTN